MEEMGGDGGHSGVGVGVGGGWEVFRSCRTASPGAVFQDETQQGDACNRSCRCSRPAGARADVMTTATCKSSPTQANHLPRLPVVGEPCLIKAQSP